MFERKQKIFEWILKESKNIKKSQESKNPWRKVKLFEGK